jgi:hypothetical protein
MLMEKIFFENHTTGLKYVFYKVNLFPRSTGSFLSVCFFSDPIDFFPISTKNITENGLVEIYKSLILQPAEIIQLYILFTLYSTCKCNFIISS